MDINREIKFLAICPECEIRTLLPPFFKEEEATFYFIDENGVETKREGRFHTRENAQAFIDKFIVEGTRIYPPLESKGEII